MKTIDPRIKIILGTASIIMIALLQNNINAIISLATGLTFLIISKIGLKKILFRFIMINGLIIFLFPFLLFGVKGAPLFTTMGLTATTNGLCKGLLIVYKLNAITFFSLSFFSTISFAELGKALQSLGLNQKLTFMIFFTTRYLEIISREFCKLKNAIKARGFTPANNLHSYRTFAFMLGSLLIRSIDRSERIHQAMICRGFHGKFYSLIDFKITKRDYFFAIVLMIFILWIGWLEYVS